MSRTLSLTLRKAFNAEYSGEVLVTLLTLTHPDHPGDTAYISSDPTQRISVAGSPDIKWGTISGGITYVYAPLFIQLPDDVDERAPQARLGIENINRDLIALIRSVSTPGKCRLQLVLASTPNTVEIDFPELDWQSANYSGTVLSFSFGIDALDKEPYPAGTFNPAYFPGLY